MEISSISFAHKYIREKRFDIISRAFEVWSNNAAAKFGQKTHEFIVKYIKDLDLDSIPLDGRVNHIEFTIDSEMNISYKCIQYGNGFQE